MLDYAGEPVELFAKDPTTFSGAPIAPEDVEAATVEVWSNDWSTLIAGPFILIYDAGRDIWSYEWDTTGKPGGVTYRTWYTLVSGGLPSWEKDEVFLALDPRAA